MLGFRSRKNDQTDAPALLDAALEAFQDTLAQCLDDWAAGKLDRDVADLNAAALRAKINGVTAPMVVDTGATSVVLTYETAKAAGLPLELLNYDVDVETAGGHTKAARLTLDRLAIGRLVERSVPALVVPHGQMKTNLLGMSFLDRLERWEVRSDRLMLHGYPERS
ncbi:MAG: TIGR02281 family clan AA aspartic protease [Bradyrhizobium sp.]|nr:TIGR02281 family clan AA aspartic protease [Bradyrhizobium sp.]